MIFAIIFSHLFIIFFSCKNDKNILCLFIFPKRTRIQNMRKRLVIFTVLFACTTLPVFSALPDRFINNSLYTQQYPQTINKKITKTATGTKYATGSTNTQNQIGKRRVIQRKNIARAAATTNQSVQQTQPRRVVQRPNTVRVANTNNMKRTIATPKTNSPRLSNNTNRNVVARASKRANATIRSSSNVRSTNSTSTMTTLSSQHCFASYKECMEDYCKREDTPYNRCFCSAKLAQIDSRYQPKIDSLIQQIIKLQYNTDGVTSDEIKSYWDKTIGSYTGTNPWTNIDNALNIKWADAESRVRGQNAFNIGHQYCVNFLRACSSMASNLRDAYKSEITRDCSAYESSLQKIQNAAESVIESYHD